MKFRVTVTTEWELETDQYDDDGSKATLLIENDIRNGDLFPSEGRGGWVQRGVSTKAEALS